MPSTSGPTAGFGLWRWRDYPTGMDGRFKPGGRVVVLEDTTGTGHYDRSTVFLDNLPFPTGIMVWHKGLLVCAAPDILYAEDTHGHGKADVVRKLYSGWATHNYQARVNSLEDGLDNWIYGSGGLFGGTITSFKGGPAVALTNRDFRIRPETGAIEAAAGRAQQGRVRNDWGDWFGCDNSASGSALSAGRSLPPPQSPFAACKRCVCACLPRFVSPLPGPCRRADVQALWAAPTSDLRLRHRRLPRRTARQGVQGQYLHLRAGQPAGAP